MADAGRFQSEVARLALTVAREHGFDEVSHTVELFGRCGDCR